MELNDNSFSSVDQSLDEIIQLKDNCEIKNTNSSLYDSSADDNSSEDENDYYEANEQRQANIDYHGRDRSKQKLMWSNKHNQLRHRFQAFDRDLKNRFFTTSVQNMKEITSSLASDRQKLVFKRKEIKNKLVDKLSRLQQSQLHLKKQIDIITGDAYGRGNYEISNLHNAFDKLEGDIDLFKRSQRVEYNELSNQETTLDKEIFNYNKRFEVWIDSDRNRERIWDEIVVASSAKKARKFKTPVKDKTVRSIRSNDKRPIELINIERKIDNDGKATGGWTARDHALFLRILSKYQLRTVVQWIVEKSKGEEEEMPLLSRGLEGRVTDMLHSVAEHLPTMTIEQIRSHWKWHCVHECRIEKKKRLVQEWRLSKNGANGSLVYDENSVDSLFTSSIHSLNSSNANALTPGSNKSNGYEERLKNKKAILEWKREKAAKARAKQEKKEKQETKKVLKRRKEREDRMMLKESIAMYKLQKEAEKAQRAAVREVILTARGKGTRRRPPSSETLRRNHERNMRELQFKKQKANIKKREQMERKERLDRLANSVAPKAIHVDVTRMTTAALRRRKTSTELDRAEEMRKQSRAHGTKYHSRTGAEHSRGKSYTFASFSGKKVASWTRGMRG